MARVTIRLDSGKVRAVVGGQSRDVTESAATTLQRRAAANAPRRSGALKKSIRVRETTKDKMRPRFSVGSNLEYAVYQELGTRGSQAAPGRVLRFTPKGSAVAIFRPRTGPVPPTRFMGRALDSLRLSDFAS